ncbi:hypothetical protein MTO96_035748 [Rhipicephalus appendiculatus]
MWVCEASSEANRTESFFRRVVVRKFFQDDLAVRLYPFAPEHKAGDADVGSDEPPKEGIWSGTNPRRQGGATWAPGASKLTKDNEPPRCSRSSRPRLNSSSLQIGEVVLNRASLIVPRVCRDVGCAREPEIFFCSGHRQVFVAFTFSAQTMVDGRFSLPKMFPIVSFRLKDHPSLR